MHIDPPAFNSPTLAQPVGARGTLVESSPVEKAGRGTLTPASVRGAKATEKAGEKAVLEPSEDIRAANSTGVVVHISAEGASRVEQDQALLKIRALQQRDREVRAHEHAHAAVGGHLTGAPSYEFVRGPDGRNYAVAGEVSVRSPVVSGDPEKTLRQAERVMRAALAPADPSGQDRKIAAAAARAAQDARLELSRPRDGTSETAEPADAGDGRSESITAAIDELRESTESQ